MTVIAYKNGVMVCDGQLTTGSDAVVTNFQKIRKIDGVGLVGFAGGAVGAQAAMDWVADRVSTWEEDIKSMGSDDVPLFSYDRQTILAVEDGRIFFFDGSGYLELGPQEYMAIGSGGTLAIGAMAAGASALDAVKAAIKHDTGCSGTPVLLELNNG